MKRNRDLTEFRADRLLEKTLELEEAAREYSKAREKDSMWAHYFRRLGQAAVRYTKAVERARRG